MRGWGLGLGWLKWGRDPVAGEDRPPLWGLEPAGGWEGPLEQMRRGWGRGAWAGPLPVLGVYHPRRLCSGWEEAAQGVGRWMRGWVWGRARGADLCGLSPCQAAGPEPSSCLSERLPPTDPPRPPPTPPTPPQPPRPRCLICIAPPQRRTVSWETGAHNKGQSPAPPPRRRTRGCGGRGSGLVENRPLREAVVVAVVLSALPRRCAVFQVEFSEH